MKQTGESNVRMLKLDSNLQSVLALMRDLAKERIVLDYLVLNAAIV